MLEAVELPVDRVAAQLVDRLVQTLARETEFPPLELVRRGEPAFSLEDDAAAWGESSPALERYRSLPEAAKKFDLLLHDPLERYWESSYTVAGKPVRFRCDFVVHLEPLPGGGTEIEVLELQPRVWVGERFLLAGHSGPGRYHDIRAVEPRDEDRLAFLAALRSALTP